MRRVEVTPYNEKWVQVYAKEAQALRYVFEACLVNIHHIGSTAVHGLHAKPIIDIMPVVWDISLVDKCTEPMGDIGYDPKGENGIPGRRYFQKGGDDRTHHVHVFQVGSSYIRRHLAFRDYLRTHPNAARHYGDLKLRLAGEFPYDIESYIHGKESLVKDIEQRALEWYISGADFR